MSCPVLCIKGEIYCFRLSKPLFSTSLFNFVRSGNYILKCNTLAVLATGLYYKLLHVNNYLFLVSSLGIEYLSIDADLC